MYKKITEYLLPGHPDRVSSTISETILDGHIKKSKDVKLDVRTTIKNQISIISGEVFSENKIDTDECVLEVADTLGYTGDTSYFGTTSIRHVSFLNDVADEVVRPSCVTYGYANSETAEFISKEDKVGQLLTHNLWEKGISRSGKCVLVSEVDGFNTKFTDVILDLENSKTIKNVESLVSDVFKSVELGRQAPNIRTVTHKKLCPDVSVGTSLSWNPSLVTRNGLKLSNPNFVGKDPSFFSRTGSLLARNIAKHVVRANFANECLISIAWGDSKDKPISISMNCFGTLIVEERWLKSLILDVFPFSMPEIINDLELSKPIYKNACMNNYFGELSGESNFMWENLNKLKFFVPL